MGAQMEHGAYAAAGVRYDAIDPLKVAAQAAGRRTTGALVAHGLAEVEASRGESAFVVDAGDHYLATLTEGLGTKNLVADAVRPLTGRSHYDQIAQDTVATILNDLATVGAAPLVLNAFWAAGSSAWFEDRERTADLVRGWEAACLAAGTAWGGGETQAIAGVVEPGSIVLGGACVGVVRPKDRLLTGDRLQTGDAIVLAPASGIHANGLTLARRLATQQPQGYASPVPDDPQGRGLGEVLLDPSPLYGPLVQALQEAGIELHYAAHITGHGWRKIMRANRDVTYLIDQIPPVPPVLAFLQRLTGMADSEAYGTFNMGAGFALFLPQQDVPRALAVGHAQGMALLEAGRVVPGPRRVVIQSLDITYEAESLQLR